MPTSFVTDASTADVSVIVVTYNNHAEIDSLLSSLRHEAEQLRIRVVIADNASADGTLDAVRRHPDVVAVESGGNIGYAGGINAGLRAMGPTRAVLILNPDLEVVPGCIRALLARLEESDAGVVVPRIEDADGHRYPSLRREPSLTRAMGDAALGRRVPHRLTAWTENIHDPEPYQTAHQIEWATGAALLIDAEAAHRIGPWDERFFLYSEETDFFRRARDLGYAVWYEPTAVVRHAQGGSGSAPELDALRAVNRVRYFAKYHAPLPTAMFYAVTVVHEGIRAVRPRQRRVARLVADRRGWPNLPHATREASPARIAAARGSIVIPAHNEAAVIGRTLRSLGPLLGAPGIEVVVAANACTDDTVAIASSFEGVQVIDTPEASKPGAINAAEAVATQWPRLYLDADIEISPAAVLDILDALASGDPLAGRPPYRWDLSGTTWPVRTYYRARGRMQRGEVALWGAGAYALSRQGRERFGAFPKVTGDDLFVDQQFSSDEKRIIQTDAVVVRVPRTSSNLMNILRRQKRGGAELGVSSAGSTVRDLLRTVSGPVSAFDAAVYAAFAMWSRRSARASSGAWERDSSSRVADQDAAGDA
ncbi:MAG: glycosyltransferase family 2 protein [Propioniciclava sp.]|uniref:glycosyltransferase family 2 protein n=1 Tax=Propioniciclava sp. TaxID=2038686 RepID=UPI0039E7187F